MLVKDIRLWCGYMDMDVVWVLSRNANVMSSVAPRVRDRVIQI